MTTRGVDSCDYQAPRGYLDLVAKHAPSAIDSMRRVLEVLAEGLHARVTHPDGIAAGAEQSCLDGKQATIVWTHGGIAYELDVGYSGLACTKATKVAQAVAAATH